MIRRGAATAAAMAVVVTTVAVATTDAGAWSEGACTTPSGVTVVVDFQELGGGVHVRCAPQPVTNGFEALRQAGIDFSTTVRFPGFLCRIAGKPANDPCQTTSPATAYWSYWVAQRGGAWCYSNLGAGARTPPPGSVEGWSFSLGRTSSTSPAPRAAVPAPLPGTAPTPLAPDDCDRRSDAPVPTTRPPRPTATTPPAIGPSGAPSPGQGTGEPGTGSTPPPGSPAGAPAGAGDDTGASGADAPTDGTVAAADDTTSDGVTDEGSGGDERSGDRSARDDGARSAASIGSDDEAVLREEATASVDLGGDRSGSSSPLGVVLAVVLVAALSGGAVLARRRSRADTSA